MPDNVNPNDPGAVWKSQPEERLSVLRPLVNRRARELYSKTRWEILMSAGAALFMAAVMAWRLGAQNDRLLQAGVAAILLWVIVTLYKFRKLLWGDEQLPPEAVAAASLEFYRNELERRRTHLRSVWVWQGPLLLALGILAVTLARRALHYFPNGVPRPGRLLWNAAPFFLILALWIAVSWGMRRRQAKEVDDEVEQLPEIQ